MVDLGIVDGVTTNPSLATKAGTPYQQAVKEIIQIVSDNVSLEVLATDAKGMIEEGRKLAKISSKVIVKFPTTARFARSQNPHSRRR